MKTARYRTPNGEELVIEYDEKTPCMSCGLPVVEASVAGAMICLWCECGVYRNGRKWDIQDLNWPELRRERAKRAVREKSGELFVGGPHDGQPMSQMESILSRFPSPIVRKLMGSARGEKPLEKKPGKPDTGRQLHKPPDESEGRSAPDNAPLDGLD